MVTDGVFLEYGNLTYVLFQHAILVWIFAAVVGFLLSDFALVIFRKVRGCFTRFSKIISNIERMNENG